MKTQPKKQKETCISIVLEATFRIVKKKKLKQFNNPSRTKG